MAGLTTIRDYFRNAVGVGINGATYSITKLFDDALVRSANTVADTDPATAIDGLVIGDETQIGYPGPIKWRATDPTTSAVREHTSKSVGIVGSWRTLDVTRAWRALGVGVQPGILSELLVSANGTDRVLSVASGTFICVLGDHSLVYSWPAVRTITADASDPSNGRVDTMVLRFYPPGVEQEGRVDLVLLKGVASSSPVAPALTQNLATYWEEALADIQVDAAVTSIAAGKVTDRRSFSFLYPGSIAAGDLFYVDANKKLARLPKGTTNQVLKQGATIPAWATLALSDITDDGTMAAQNASAVAITGGTITGITDLAVLDGGTGASDAATARTNLGAAAAVHTHVASDTTNFDTAVRTSRLDQMAAPTAAVSINGQRLTSVSDPSSAQDAATKAYVDAVASGLDLKASVRVASTANVTISGPGAAIDGVTLSNGDRVLLKNQTTASENGIYVFNGAASAMTRAPDADASVEVTSGMFVFVEEGTANTDQGYALTTNNPITLGSTSLTFTQISGAGQITAGSGLTKTGNALAIDNTVVATLNDVQTFTNKTFTAPTIASFVNATHSHANAAGGGLLSTSAITSLAEFIRDTIGATLAAGANVTVTVDDAGDSITIAATNSGGDASTNTSVSVNSEMALFSGTLGKTLKRATGSGYAKMTSGVYSAQTPGTPKFAYSTRASASGSVTSTTGTNLGSLTVSVTLDAGYQWDLFCVGSINSNAPASDFIFATARLDGDTNTDWTDTGTASGERALGFGHKVTNVTGDGASHSANAVMKVGSGTGSVNTGWIMLVAIPRLP